MKILTLLIALMIATPAVAQNYTKDDFSGMGINEGQARRLADEANRNSSNTFQRDNFKGLGVSPGTASRAADRLNNQYNNSYDTMPSNQNSYGSDNNGSNNSYYGY